MACLFSACHQLALSTQEHQMRFAGYACSLVVAASTSIQLLGIHTPHLLPGMSSADLTVPSPAMQPDENLAEAMDVGEPSPVGDAQHAADNVPRPDTGIEAHLPGSSEVVVPGVTSPLATTKAIPTAGDSTPEIDATLLADATPAAAAASSQAAEPATNHTTMENAASTAIHNEQTVSAPPVDESMMPTVTKVAPAGSADAVSTALPHSSKNTLHPPETPATFACVARYGYCVLWVCFTRRTPMAMLV